MELNQSGSSEITNNGRRTGGVSPVVCAATRRLTPPVRQRPRLALVHDWLTGMRGGEKCLEVLCRIWPDAHLYTLIHRRGATSPAIERMSIRTSFLQRIPGIVGRYRYFLPLMPLAVESLRLDGYDLVISLSHCVAKSVRVPAGVPHVCYCFTPMRYAWHMRGAYFGQRAGSIGFGWIRNLVLADLRRWDRWTARRVTSFVAISRTIQQRIRECYGRPSTVIYPPVDTDGYSPAALGREDFYLCVSALAPYKRLDQAVAAANRLRSRLVIIGSGPERERLRAMAGPTVQFLGWQPDEVIRDYYRRCRALLFPGIEDFGIVPLEAQACAAPVIAYAAGGATETVVPPGSGTKATGLLYRPQSAEALGKAMSQFQSHPQWFCPKAARANAERFRTGRFARAMEAYVRSVLQQSMTQPSDSSFKKLAA